MSAASTPRSPRFDLPPAPVYTHSSATDNGLAEWTSRIKAMQRQVDADDEAEQRRLEEEIVRARLARSRRSKTGQSGDFGVGMHGIDLSKLQEESPISHTPRTDNGTFASEEQPASTVSMPKPAIRSASSSGDKSAPMSLAAFIGGTASGPRLKRHEPQLDASLAYDGRTEHGSVHPIFGRAGVAMPGMAGRGGAGAPPTPSAPASTPLAAVSNPAPQTPLAVASELSRSRTTSTSNVARRYVEKLEEQGPTKSQTPKLSSVGLRERRISTPSSRVSGELKVSTPATLSRPLSQNIGGRTPSPDTRAKSPITGTRPKTPIASVEIRPKTPTSSEVRPKTPVAEPRPNAPVVMEPRSQTPATEFRTKTPVVEPRGRTPGADTTRAKTPVQSSPTQTSFPSAAPWQTPRHQPSTNLPSVSLSDNTVPLRSAGPPSPVRATHAPQPHRGVSPGFLRLPMASSAKDPTPSISRLQGRGFVHSIVRASDRLGGDAQGSPSTNVKQIFPSSSPTPVQGGEVREKSARRASVLDRWQPVMNSSSKSSTPSPPPQTSKTSTPTRSHVVNFSAKPGQGQDVSVVKTHDTGRSVRSAVSLPAIPKTPLKKPEGLSAQDTLEKLGSSSTMISYIKPTKTGDDPVVPDVDELGVRISEGGGAVGGAGMTNHGAGRGVGASAVPAKTKTPRVSGSPLPSSPGKPLSHPTKDRAKKPRKARFEEGLLAPAEAAEVLSNSPPTLGTEVAKPTQSPTSASVPSTATDASDASAPRLSLDAPTRSHSEPAPQLKITPPSTTGRVTDRWTEPTLIGLKPPPSPLTNKPPPSPKPVSVTGMVGRRALPGLANPTVATAVEKDDKPISKDKEERTVPSSPTKHTRIPSTGNRALVMEVAQAFNAAQQGQQQPEDAPANRPLPISASGASVEKRKSSYERYSSIAMPPLKEERTPVTSPANTMSRTAAEKVFAGNVVSESPMSSLRADSSAPDQPLARPRESSKLHIDHVDEPLPDVDVGALLSDSPIYFTPDPDVRTISVEVMSVIQSSVTPVQRETNIFYDAEVLVIVHRAKSRESGLVATKLWCWKGKKCHYGEREEKKIWELARRYGTSAEAVSQQHEPSELVHVLGGQLAIRQGARAHWSSENTTMHVVRSSNHHTLIDEVDLNIRNLCSGYSYCVSILDNIYVWHGRGSVIAERTAALEYARGMAAKGTSVVELTEGENDTDDEMFWMIVGDSDSYAKADYWKWRSTTVPSEPRCWAVDVVNLDAPIRLVPVVSAETVLQESVHIIDCSWEFFVLVGKHARAKRPDITLAISTAKAMTDLLATSKPFLPTVHVLIIPTQLPLDMRHAFRDLDESTLNGGFIPDHMNILSTTEAIEHLRTSSWDKSALKDHTMLPLGLDSSHVPLP